MADFTLPLSTAPAVQTAPIPDQTSTGTNVFANANSAANTTAQPFVAASQAIDASDAKSASDDAAAQQKALAQAYLQHLQTGLGGMKQYIDEVSQQYPDLGKSMSAQLPNIQLALADPTIDAPTAREYLTNYYKAFSGQYEQASKEKAAQDLADSKQKEDAISPIFAAAKPAIDAIITQKKGVLTDADRTMIRTLVKPELNGYKPFETYLASGGKTTGATSSRSNPATNTPYTEKELMDIAESVKTSDELDSALPRGRMSPPLYAAARAAAIRMIRGTYTPGSYNKQISKIPSGGQQTAPQGSDITAPATAPTPGNVPPVPAGATPSPNAPDAIDKTFQDNQTPPPGMAKPLPTQSQPKPQVQAPTQPIGTPPITDFNPVLDKGNAKYANSAEAKKATANIQNARSTIGAIQDFTKTIDNTRFPTMNAWIKSGERGVGQVQARMKDMLESMGTDEVQKALARGGVGNELQLKLAKSMIDLNGSPQQISTSMQTLLDALDRADAAVRAPGGRFMQPTATNKAPKLQALSKASSDSDIAAYLQAKSQPATPANIKYVKSQLSR